MSSLKTIFLPWEERSGILPSAGESTTSPAPALSPSRLLGLMVQCAGFAAEMLSCAINPDIHGLDLLPLWQLHVHVLDGFAQVGAR